MTTPIRLLDMGAPRYMVAFSLQLVIAQRLVRLICESCAEPHQLLPSERLWLMREHVGKLGDHRYMKGKGCSRCNGSGYLSRTGVYEMLEMTRPVIEAITQEDPGIFMKAAEAEIGRDTLRAHAAALVAQGRTTVEEAMRASNQIEDAAVAAPVPAPESREPAEAI
jgi:MSHA biogenesis protein MshE